MWVEASCSDGLVNVVTGHKIEVTYDRIVFVNGVTKECVCLFTTDVREDLVAALDSLRLALSMGRSSLFAFPTPVGGGDVSGGG